MQRAVASSVTGAGRHLQSPIRSYIIARLLAEGSFGRIFLGECDGLHVAIKETKEPITVALMDFAHEVVALRSLTHRALPQMLDSFIVDNYGYIVIEYINGMSLSAYVDAIGNDLPESTLLDLIEPVVDALNVMQHWMPPILHYDIKPDNIQIDAAGQAYLIDFGSIGVGGAQRALTRSIYSPLEQLDGRVVDQRGQLYSLGATLYAVLTGSLPPSARQRDPCGSDIALLLTARRPDISTRLAAIIVRLMHPDLVYRYQGVSELQRDMTLLRTGTPALAIRPQNTQLVWLEVSLAMGAAILCLVLVALALVIWFTNRGLC